MLTDLLSALVDLDIQEFAYNADAFRLRATHSERRLQGGSGVGCVTAHNASSSGRVTGPREEHVLTHHSQGLESEGHQGESHNHNTDWLSLALPRHILRVKVNDNFNCKNYTKNSNNYIHGKYTH